MRHAFPGFRISILGLSTLPFYDLWYGLKTISIYVTTEGYVACLPCCPLAVCVAPGLGVFSVWVPAEVCRVFQIVVCEMERINGDQPRHDLPANTLLTPSGPRDFPTVFGPLCSVFTIRTLEHKKSELMEINIAQIAQKEEH